MLEAVEEIVKDKVVARVLRGQERLRGLAVKTDTGEHGAVEAEKAAGDRFQLRLVVHGIHRCGRMVEDETLDGREGASTEHEGPAKRRAPEAAALVKPQVLEDW